MENVILNNKLECPVVGIGTFMLSPEDAQNSVREALKMGYRLIDTANAYVNERAVGRGIKESDVAREEIFLSTKLWPSEYENENAVDETLERLGVDRVLIPEQEHAHRVARSLVRHNVLDYIELSEEYGILDVPAPKSWIGKTLKELNVRAKLGVNIIAVESGKKTNVSPAADYLIREGDIMVVLGDTYSLEAVQKL